MLTKTYFKCFSYKKGNKVFRNHRKCTFSTLPFLGFEENFEYVITFEILWFLISDPLLASGGIGPKDFTLELFKCNKQSLVFQKHT